jgi:coenzyme F420-0:L-glutamate ligase/coenzyme F420-1:gamma-L-glutamate ligase
MAREEKVPKKIEAFSIKLPPIEEGDDLGKMISKRLDLMDDDILVIAHTVVSKSEGRIRRLKEINPGDLAFEIAKKKKEDPRFVQAVLDETKEILIDHPIFLVEANCRNICINAGVDRSNVEEGYLILLPRDPDASAERIRRRIFEMTRKRVGVIISDTNGRPFRIGQVGFSIGIYGIEPIRDWKGKKDIFGKKLKITEEAIADELAGMSNILMGEGDWLAPVVVIRGLSILSDEKKGIKRIYRDEGKDYIRMAIKNFYSQ